MKVSIIMPVYNRENVVKEAIESILVQTMGDFELIILDDFSTDHSVEVIESIHDPRIKLIKAPFKTNIPILRNAGLQIAEGEYVGDMDSDDIAEPDRLKWEVEFLDSNRDYGVVSGYFKTFGNSETLVTLPNTHEEIVGSLPVRSSIANGACLLRKSVVNSIKVRPEYFVCEDYAYWVDLIGKTKFANLDKVLINVRYWDQQTTANSWQEEYKLSMRSAIIKEIHKSAFANLKIDLTNEEVTLFSYFMADTARFNKYNNKDVSKITDLVGRIFDKMQITCPQYAAHFRNASESKINKIKQMVKSDI